MAAIQKTGDISIVVKRRVGFRLMLLQAFPYPDGIICVSFSFFPCLFGGSPLHMPGPPLLANVPSRCRFGPWLCRGMHVQDSVVIRSPALVASAATIPPNAKRRPTQHRFQKTFVERQSWLVPIFHFWRVSPRDGSGGAGDGFVRLGAPRQAIRRCATVVSAMRVARPGLLARQGFCNRLFYGAAHHFFYLHGPKSLTVVQPSLAISRRKFSIQNSILVALAELASNYGKRFSSSCMSKDGVKYVERNINVR